MRETARAVFHNANSGLRQPFAILPITSTLENAKAELLFLWRIRFQHLGESSMEQAIDRVMRTYGMIVNLTPADEQVVREKVSKFLGQKSEDDEQKLTIAGLQYVRELKI
jgi:hypothetical protein